MQDGIREEQRKNKIKGLGGSWLCFENIFSFLNCHQKILPQIIIEIEKIFIVCCLGDLYTKVTLKWPNIGQKSLLFHWMVLLFPLAEKSKELLSQSMIKTRAFLAIGLSYTCIVDYACLFVCLFVCVCVCVDNIECMVCGCTFVQLFLRCHCTGIYSYTIMMLPYQPCVNLLSYHFSIKLLN